MNEWIHSFQRPGDGSWSLPGPDAVLRPPVTDDSHFNNFLKAGRMLSLSRRAEDWFSLRPDLTLNMYSQLPTHTCDNMALDVVKAIQINAESIAGSQAKEHSSPFQGGEEPQPQRGSDCWARL